MRIPKKSVSWSNWWEKHTCNPKGFYEPRTTEEIVGIVKSAVTKGEKIKVIGSGHSWSDIPCTAGSMISLGRFNQVIALNRDKQLATVQAGLKIYELNAFLSKHNLVLPALGSISEQSIAGAISTGTHGASLHQKGLASLVVELEIVDGTGRIIRCSEDHNPNIFYAALIGLGSLGLITQVTIQCVERFLLTERLECWNINSVIENLSSLSEKEYFRMWYVTTKEDAIVQCFSSKESRWGDNSSSGPIRQNANTLLWHYWLYRYYTSKKTKLPPFRRTDWSDKIQCFSRTTLKLYKLGFVLTKPCKEILISEYGIPAEEASTVMEKILDLVDIREIEGHLRFEVRYGAAEDIWLSGSYKRNTCYIQTIFEKKNFESAEAQADAFLKVEALMKSFDGRPHWAKDHYFTGVDLKKVYPCWDKFSQIREELDPYSCFRNNYLNRIFDNGEGD